MSDNPALPEPAAWLRTNGAGTPVITEAFLRSFPSHRRDFADGLFTADQMRAFYAEGFAAGVAAGKEQAAKNIEHLRDEHCRLVKMSDNKLDWCEPEGGDGCEFVEAWNDAIAAIRAKP